jgi:hypothetical protein
VKVVAEEVTNLECSRTGAAPNRVVAAGAVMLRTAKQPAVVVWEDMILVASTVVLRRQ